MSLKAITYALIFSMGLSFLLRAAGTLFPAVFLNVHIARGTLMVHMGFILVQLLFYIFFFREHAARRQRSLKAGSVSAVIGVSLVSAVYLKNFCRLFDLDIVPLVLQRPFLDAGIPLAGALLQLLFFGFFKKSQTRTERRMLDRAISGAITGIGIFIVLHLIVLLNFVKFQKFDWLADISRMAAMSTLPLMVFAVILLLRFYFKFYQFLLSSERQNR